MGDKGQKDKNKNQKQKSIRNAKENKRKHDKQEKASGPPALKT